MRILDVDDCVLYGVDGEADGYTPTLRPLVRSDAQVPPASYAGLLGRCEREKHVLNLKQGARDVLEGGATCSPSWLDRSASLPGMCNLLNLCAGLSASSSPSTSSNPSPEVSSPSRRQARRLSEGRRP